jgi:hypothetical protein
MELQQPIFPVLIRPADPGRVEALRVKEDEYNDRIEEYDEKHPRADLNQRSVDLAEEMCGVTILEPLLGKGAVYGFDAAVDFFGVLKELPGPVAFKNFYSPWQNAWREIKTICEDA